MVARRDRHPEPRALPPVDPWPDGKDDPVLGRWLVRSSWHDEAGGAHAVRLELLDDDAVEEGAQLVGHCGPA